MHLLSFSGLHNENGPTTGNKAHVAAIAYKYVGVIDYVLGPNNVSNCTFDICV